MRREGQPGREERMRSSPGGTPVNANLPWASDITDGTAGSGLPRGATATLGGYPITVGDTALLADGTIAGSVLTMDRAFALLASTVGVSLVDAATMCATTPARELGLQGLGVIAPGSKADLAVLDRNFRVRQT